MSCDCEFFVVSQKGTFFFVDDGFFIQDLACSLVWFLFIYLIICVVDWVLVMVVILPLLLGIIFYLVDP